MFIEFAICFLKQEATEVNNKNPPIFIKYLFHNSSSYSDSGNNILLYHLVIAYFIIIKIKIYLDKIKYKF